jgi:2-polyprenyl-6-methoxyphenol hydroxylase-like FAD-dependent oxidoreductase
MQSTNQPDVVICGAGACGLTLAIELARRNISFIVIDRASGPFQGSRGKAIQPRTLEIFEDLGIVGQVMGSGGGYPLLRTYSDAGPVDTQMMLQSDPTPAEPYRNTTMLPQFMSEAIMRDRLAEFGSSVQFDTELTGFDQDANGVTVRLRRRGRDDTLRTRYLVGADGGKSFIRQDLALEFPGKTLPTRGLVADLLLDGLTPEFWHRWNEKDPTHMSLCPLRGTNLFQLQGTLPLEGEDDLSLAGLSALIAVRTQREDLKIREVKWASAYNMNARLAERYRIGRIFLAGDAAHIHPPTGGQGLNTSVQDAYNLGWKLAAVLSGASDALLDSYEAERRPIAAGMLGLATTLLNAARQGDLRRGRDVQQLDLGYADTPVALEKPARTAGLHVGDRAPDAPCRSAGGPAMRLFDLFKGPHWTLLGYDTDLQRPIKARPGLRIHTTGPRGDIVDDADFIRLNYGLSPGDWILVRPDKYIGAWVSEANLRELDGFLTRMGCGQADPSTGDAAAPS